MKIYDISRELLSAPVYPGDQTPALKGICRINKGDVCNTSVMSFCVHNATHLDAPLHFIEGADDITCMPLSDCIGNCIVVSWNGVLSEGGAKQLIINIQEPIDDKYEATSMNSKFFEHDYGARVGFILNKA